MHLYSIEPFVLPFVSPDPFWILEAEQNGTNRNTQAEQNDQGQKFELSEKVMSRKAVDGKKNKTF